MRIHYRQLLPARSRRWLRSLIVECGMRNCRSFHLSHPVLQRLPGIFLDRTWYCSPRCLEEALTRRLKTQLGAATTDLRHAPRMPFRLILLAEGRVSEAQLARARAVQATGSAGRDVGDVLIHLGYSTEDEVAAARAAEAGCPFYGGAAQPIGAAYPLPVSWMHHHHASPVHHTPAAGRLLIGFVYRVHRPLFQAIEQVTGCRAEACIIPASIWKQQLASLPAPAFAEVHEAASTQERAVSMILNHAMSSRADKLRTGISGDTLWVRMAGGLRGRDLIINLAAQSAPRIGVTEQQDGAHSSRPAINATKTSLRSARETSVPVFVRRPAAV